jgi:hypothetical protein
MKAANMLHVGGLSADEYRSLAAMNRKGQVAAKGYSRGERFPCTAGKTHLFSFLFVTTFVQIAGMGGNRRRSRKTVKERVKKRRLKARFFLRF